jgi:hypothetical protein
MVCQNPTLLPCWKKKFIKENEGHYQIFEELSDEIWNQASLEVDAEDGGQLGPN